MKAIDNQIRNISSSHQDKHSDKVNSHQHHGGDAANLLI